LPWVLFAFVDTRLAKMSLAGEAVFNGALAAG